MLRLSHEPCLSSTGTVDLFDNLDFQLILDATTRPTLLCFLRYCGTE